jgi:hypothetical protein
VAVIASEHSRYERRRAFAGSDFSEITLYSIT